MQNQQQTPGEQITLRGGFNFAYLLASGHATCFTPFLHCDFGSEALGVNGIAALFIMLLYIAQTGSPGMESFVGVWLMMVLLQRIRTAMLCRQGCVTHSRYGGFPWLTMKFARDERTAKSMEPVICGLAGAILMPYDEALGTFVLAGFLSMLLKLVIEWRIDQVSVQRMRDTEIEQRWLVQQNRNRR